ncbi:MAG: hypothetical protein ABJC13_05450 [Acidobacteriota bacterium]
MNWIVLGFLPIDRMRQSRHPAYGAACGQLLLARRTAYETAGGPRSPASSMTRSSWLAASAPAGPWSLALSTVALTAGWAARFAAAIRFRQPLLGALLHPLGIALFLAIQWHALARHYVGKPAVWKGRALAG